MVSTELLGKEFTLNPSQASDPNIRPFISIGADELARLIIRVSQKERRRGESMSLPRSNPNSTMPLS